LYKKHIYSYLSSKQKEMTTDSEKTCRNCGSTMPSNARYCPACSQEYTTGRVPFQQFISDFFAHYFNFDSRLFRTVRALFIPGQLTNEYFLGKHKSYANPIQLFLVATFFLFALVGGRLSNADLGDDASLSLKEDLDWIDFYEKLDTAKMQTDSLFPNQAASIAIDTLIKKMQAYQPNLEDSLDISGFTNFGKDIVVPPIAKKDLLLKSPNELVEIYAKDKGFMEKVILRQSAKFKMGGRGIIEYFFGKLTIILLLMMPALALILKLLYIRRDYFYVEHLIFTFHFHAFLFFILFVLGLIGSYLPGFLLGPAILGIFVYLFWAMKKVYKQSKRKTFVKFTALLMSYFFVSLLFTVLSFIISFFLF
jgi:Protein of unknown function (DUF3667)